MARKSFRASEATDMFMNQDPEPVKEDPKTPEEKYMPPEGYKLVPTETKSVRIQLLTAPSTKRKLADKAQIERRSMNEIINAAILEYLDK